MTESFWLRASDRWFRTLLRLYPVDFREEMGDAMAETYRDRCRDALRSGGVMSLFREWVRGLGDSVRNGPGEHVQPAVRWRRGGNWGRDIELATRRLMRAPMFALATIGTLTVGLGAFAVVYTAYDKILLAEMPYEDPDDLYYVWRDYRAMFDLDRGWLGGTDVAELQKSGGVIEDAVALRRVRAVLSGQQGLDPTEIALMTTTPNLFDVLGVTPAMGRGFAPNEVGPDHPRVTVLTHTLWNRLGADRNIVGKEIVLNGQKYNVIGVMPKTFTFMRNSSLGPPQGADAYIPLPDNLAETDPGAGSYAGLIRVRRGTTPTQVAAAIDGVARVIDERDFESRGLKLWPVGLKPDLVEGIRPALTVLAFAGTFLVLVLMVNLATLLLARATQRGQEFAVSRALGANPIAIMRATVVEGTLLGIAGGIAAALLSIWGTRMLVALAPLDLPRKETIAVDWKIGLVVVGVGAVLGLLAAIVPATWSARASLATLLSNAAVRGGGGQGTMRRGMVVVQVALSLVLLSTGGLVVRSFERLLREDPGFNPENLLTFRVPIPVQLFPDSAHAVALQDQVVAALGAIPGVSTASGITALPLSATASNSTIEIPGAPGNTGEEEHDSPLVDYFGVRENAEEALGLHIITGRALDPVRRPGVHEALIDQPMVDYFFPTGNPLGAKIPLNDTDSATVVGVIEQPRHYNVHENDRPQLYLRAEVLGSRTLSYVLRSARPPESLIRDVQTALRAVDPQLAVSEVKTGQDLVGDSLRQQHISAVLVAGFSLGALILAAMGLFGVVSASVTRRKHEIAVRLALGADYGRVLRLMLGEGARLIGLGVLIGVPATYYAGRAISSFLVGVSPTDPATLGGVGFGLAAVALFACYIPARRVLGIEPARSLRQE
jgi:putative ABC transport system permease protein